MLIRRTILTIQMLITNFTFNQLSKLLWTSVVKLDLYLVAASIFYSIDVSIDRIKSNVNLARAVLFKWMQGLLKTVFLVTV